MAATASRKNAIEKRLEILVGLWNEFAEDPEARMLRWLVDQDEARMVDVFLEVQNEETGDVPDLFIRFEEPFADPSRYGFALVQSLRQKYEEIREGIRSEGIPADWTCPAAGPKDTDIQAFLACCRSFYQHYKSMLVHLVCVLAPARIAGSKPWQAWLQKLLRSGLPENLRLLVIDGAGDPRLGDLAKAEPVLVRTVEPELDMPAAMAELVRGIPGKGPGFDFRKYFVALTNLAGKGDLGGAAKAAGAALAIASREGWLQMQVVIHMTLGATLLGAKKSDEALSSYRKAGQVAEAAAKQGDPAGPKLVLQTRLAEGAVLLNNGRPGEAAKVYEQAAAVAEQLKDHLMALESWRMAAYGHELSKKPEESWRCGNLALDAAERMDADGRKNSTLPFAGQGLLRILKRRDKERIQSVKDRMIKIAGPDWEKKLELEGAAS